MTVDLTRPAPSGGLTLGYSVGGTATAGSGNDFTIQNSGTVSIAVGASTATIPVAINDDSSAESAETVILTLTGGTGYTLGSPSVHTLTITDNDSSGQPAASFAASFAAGSSSAAESAGTRNVRVNLSSAAPFRWPHARLQRRWHGNSGQRQRLHHPELRHAVARGRGHHGNHPGGHQ